MATDRRAPRPCPRARGPVARALRAPSAGGRPSGRSLGSATNSSASSTPSRGSVHQRWRRPPSPVSVRFAMPTAADRRLDDDHDRHGNRHAQDQAGPAAHRLRPGELGSGLLDEHDEQAAQRQCAGADQRRSEARSPSMRVGGVRGVVGGQDGELPVRRAETKASCGISMAPTYFARFFLPSLLLLEQLALATDVAAVALGEHVLALGLDRLAGDHARADRGLDGYVEHLSWDELAQLRDHRLAVLVGAVAVHDRGEGVDRLAVEQDVDLHEVADLQVGGLVVQAGVAARDRLQLIEEVGDDLGER